MTESYNFFTPIKLGPMEDKLDSFSDKYNQLNFSCSIHYTYHVETPVSGDSKVTSM